MNLKEIDLTEEIIFLENEKKEAAREMDQEFHMIWIHDSKVIPSRAFIEKKDVNVEEIFNMFPEISPAFFKNFPVKELNFRFKGGSVTFIRKDS